MSEVKTAILYYQSPSFEYRKKLVAELMALSLGQECPVKEWGDILAEIGRIQSFRNTIAHHPARQIGSIIWDMHADGGPKVHSVEHWLEVTTQEKELLRGKRKPVVIRVEEMKQHAKDVSALHGKFTSFLKEFKASSTRNRQADQQDTSPGTSA